jgi:hypothetical protein
VKESLEKERNRLSLMFTDKERKGERKKCGRGSLIITQTESEREKK